MANGRLLREGPFTDIWIQPAAGDAGGALGAALFVWHRILGHNKPATETGPAGKQRRPTTGTSWPGLIWVPEYSEEEIKAWLDLNRLPYKKLAPDQLVETTADLLAGEKVVGWFQGRTEFGPRALGNRSIIGDARSPGMQRTMNLKIKYRESFPAFRAHRPEGAFGRLF